MTSYIDESLIQSELCGLLLILLILWLVLVQGLLWQVWVRERYAGAIDTVKERFDLSIHQGWRCGVTLLGRIDGHRVAISWKGGPCAVRARVKVKRSWRWSHWSGWPSLPVERMIERILDLCRVPAQPPR